jgi:hypothetical protein
VAGQAAKPAVITMAFTQHQPSAAIFGVHMVMANPGDRPSNLMVTSQMPASVHSLANATRKPNGNVDSVILHYKAINAELETQLAVACAQRDAYRELVEYCWRLVDAERKRLFK